MNKIMIDRLKKLAHSKCFYDDADADVTVDDYAAGNIDDAFAVGETVGEVMLARDVLESLGIDWGDEE